MRRDVLFLPALKTGQASGRGQQGRAGSTAQTRNPNPDCRRLSPWGVVAVAKVVPGSDLNQDGEVRADDHGLLLAVWGPCC